MPSRLRKPPPPPLILCHPPQPRPWPTLPAQSQQQLAQGLARLLRRLREEARHADRAQ